MAAKKSTPPKDERFGWVDNPSQINEVLGELRMPVFGVAASASNITGSGKGKIALLYRAVLKVLSRFPIHLQTIGDCTSHALGGGLDVLKCTRIVHKNLAEQFVAETATEVTYAGARVEIAHGRFGNEDGATGGSVVMCAKKLGTLGRLKYQVPGGMVDLRQYSGRRARLWGRPNQGIPDALEPTMREHPVLTASLLLSFEEACDAIANSYVVLGGSMQGFTEYRDKDGFALPSGEWPHAMYFMGSDYKSKRPGLLLMNSWGPSWIRGPKRFGDEPDGSFWVDAKVCNIMFSQRDYWVISGFNGYPAQQSAEGDDLLLV